MKTCPLLLMLCPRRKCLACNEAFLNESAFQDHKLSMRHKRNFYAYFFKEHRYVIANWAKIRKKKSFLPKIFETFLNGAVSKGPAELYAHKLNEHGKNSKKLLILKLKRSNLILSKRFLS